MNSKLLRGSLDTVVLKMLHDKGEMYGYEITQRARAITDGQVEITEGALYPILHKLEAKGVLEVEVRNIGNRMRKYYRLTENGSAELDTQLADWKQYVEGLSLIFNPSINL